MGKIVLKSLLDATKILLGAIGLVLLVLLLPLLLMALFGVGC